MRNSLLFESRREFLWLAATGGAGVISASCRSAESGKPAEATKKDDKEENVSPAEDLMHDHGVLDKRRLNHRPQVHRGLSREIGKDHLFPRFEKSGKLVDIVRILREQHQAGRVLTDRIEQQSTLLSSKNQGERNKLEKPIRAFIRMYRPHAAREDTVLFPAFRQLVSKNEYDALGEEFEEQEHRLFGERVLKRLLIVAAIERKFGIEDLAHFTPRV